MFFRNLKPKDNVELDVTPAHVMLPVHIPLDDARAAFSDPLARQLAAVGLGVVSESRARLHSDGSSDGLDLFLGLTRSDDDALSDVITLLEHLGAPKGSRLRLVDGGSDRIFGRAIGMEVSVCNKGGSHAARVDRMSRACAQAVGKSAILQGTRALPDRINFYFYGVDYGIMREGLAEKLDANPMLSGATLRPLS